MRSGIFSNTDVNEALGLMFGTESIRSAMQKETLLDTVAADDGVANLALPEPIQPPPLRYPPLEGDVEVEPLATAVPHECLYVRFGSFTNYLWLRDFLSRWRGDLANMIALRSIDYGIDAKLETQLGLKENALARVLGPTIIADVAIIGSDTFLREGAAIGILFEARNNFALGTDLRRQRSTAQALYEDGGEETIAFGEFEISYVHGGQGKLRSYYAQHNDFHLVTTSRHMAERFLEATASGKDTLAASEEFRYARSIVPISRDDTVFIYLSDAFFRQMISPHYRIEMTRRMKSLAEIDAVLIARLAAQGEGVAATTPAQLVAADLLPSGFGVRADGSQLVEQDEQLADSRRGRPGYFVPVPDIELTAVTAAEIQAYARFADIYQQQWQQVDPVIAAISRQPSAIEGQERIVADLLVTPFDKSKYSMLNRFLGPPSYVAKRPLPEEVASLELQLRPGGFFGGTREPTHAFAGLLDFRSPLVVSRGKVDYGAPPAQFVRGYIGSRPPLGILDTLLGGAGRGEKPADPEGYEQLSDDTWRRQLGDAAVFSFKREVLELITPQLEFYDAPRPAQVRLRIDDLSQRYVADLVNSFGYQRARQASLSGSRFMNSLTQQLHVSPEQGRDIAEMLVGGRLVDPLEGAYELTAIDDGHAVWVSNALTPQNQFMFIDLPPAYTFPMLRWFRGLQAELSLTGDTLEAHVELEMSDGRDAAPDNRDVPPSVDQPLPPQPEELPPPRGRE